MCPSVNGSPVIHLHLGAVGHVEKKNPPRTGDIGGLSRSQGHNILQNKEENTPNPSEQPFLLRQRKIRREGEGEGGGE